MKNVEIYSDGACRGNPGPGGWGALMRCDGHEKSLFGGEPLTTNNRMEMLAAIRALEALKQECNVVITTDSEYLRKGMTEWISGWKARGWKTAARKPVKNMDLWQQLDELVGKHQVEWRWVRGHTGHPGNEAADQLANRGIDEMRASS